MIGGFRDGWLRAFFVDDVHTSRIPNAVQDQVFRRLQMIDDAVTDRDLRVPPGNHFEKLRGHLQGYCSVRVNRRRRLIFRWDADTGEATDLYLDDHRYR